MNSGNHHSESAGGAGVKLASDEQQLAGIPPDPPSGTSEGSGRAVRIAKRHVRHVAVVSSIGGLLYGYDTGVISGSILQITADFNLKSRFGGGVSHITELVTAAILLGAVIGALATSALVGRVGRRRTIIVVAAVFALGVIFSALSGDWWILALSRVFLGLGVGGSTQVVPSYISEMAPSDTRGRYVTMFNIAIGVGILAASAVNFFATSLSWHWRIGVPVVPAVVLLIAMLPLPESPRWLVTKDYINPARRVMRWVRPSRKAADAEVQETKELHEREIRSTPGKGTSGEWRSVLHDKWLRPAIFAGVMVAIFTQITGLEMMIYYTPTLLKNGAGFSEHLAQGGNVGVGIVYLVMTIVGNLVVDKVGRRSLALIMLPGAAASFVAFGVSFWLADGYPPPGLIIGLILAFMFFQAGGIQVIGWLMGSEIYPLQIRSVATSLHAAALWIADLVITVTALTLIQTFTLPGAMLFYAALNVTAWFVIFFRVPETKGRSLEDIERSLKNGTFLPFKRQEDKAKAKLRAQGWDPSAH